MANEEERENILEVVKASSNRQDCQTFVLHGENHTLGNAVRYLIMKNPETKLCGYSVPHPSQHKINLRIETNNEKDAIEVFRTGLQDLDQVCDHVLKTFDECTGKHQSS